MPFTHATLAAALSSLLCTGLAARAAPAGDPAITRADLARVPRRPAQRACGDVTRPHQLRCHAQVLVGPTGAPLAAGPNDGLVPGDIVSAYDLPASGGAGVTVALVDAFDDPNAESDLAVYRAQFGLPACTTANGCFKKVNQSGDASPLPGSDSGWGTEISLDLDAVSAACPSCNILLVEADSDSNGDLAASVDTAASLGASAISNSYGGAESSGDDGTGYQHPGVLITASTGDNGYGVEYPASLANVLAVGGTSLVQSSGQARGWSEAAWSGGGSGCSTIQAKPSYQTDSGCAFRTVADVSAVADPNTGLSIYDTFGSGNTGWEVVGGTSLSSPTVAAIFARSSATSVSNAFAYQNSNAFFDVTSGANGSCGGSYLCTAGTGYDGPTGMGTPDGALIAQIITSGGSGGGSGGGTLTCPPGETLQGVTCVSSSSGGGGCSSSGPSGLVSWGACFAFAAAGLWSARRRRA